MTTGRQHICQLANFYGPRSGGLRTALNALGAGYAAAGHRVSLVVPGQRRAYEVLPSGVHRYTLPAPKIPGTGGYRAVAPHRVRALLEQLRPDALEVSDRLTLRGMGVWAAERGVPSVVISHERLDRLLEQYLCLTRRRAATRSVPGHHDPGAGRAFLLPGGLARRVADNANRRMASSYDTVVCTTEFARAEFDRIAAGNVVRVPLGVDLATFDPSRRDDGWRYTLSGGADALLVHCGRLSPEKHVERSVDTVAELTESGHHVRLVIAGDGPRRRALERRAHGLPVTFLGFVGERTDVARLLASADISLAPGPHETFGLAALEALASGTPVVVSASSALPEIVRPACGAACDDNAPAFAGAVSSLLDRPEDQRRIAARTRAEEFAWPAAVRGMLRTLHA